MKPGALEANKYMPPNNFSINDAAMNMLKTWDVIARVLDILDAPPSQKWVLLMETWTRQSQSMKQQLDHGTKAL